MFFPCFIRASRAVILSVFLTISCIAVCFGQSTICSSYSYDEQGKITLIRSVYSDSSELYSAFYYDSIGRPLREIEFDSINMRAGKETTYHYSPDGKDIIVMEKLPADLEPKMMNHRRLNAQGNVIRDSIFSRSGRCLLIMKYKYEDSLCTEALSLDEKGDVFMTTKYTYNKHGNLIETQEIERNITDIYTYDYNKKNQCARVSLRTKHELGGKDKVLVVEERFYSTTGLLVRVVYHDAHNGIDSFEGEESYTYDESGRIAMKCVTTDDIED